MSLYTDKETLTRRAYRDGGALAARQSIYQWQRPRIDLPGTIIDELSDVTGTVADVGCGNGVYVTRLREQRPELRVIGLDLSLGMRPTLVADAQSLPLPDASVDAALALHMLYHVPDIPRAIAELRRIVKPGGLLIASANGAGHTGELTDIRDRAIVELGGQATGQINRRFGLENGAQFLRQAFAQVEVHELTAIAEVPEAAAVTAYVDSTRSMVQTLLPDRVEWTAVVDVVQRLADETIARDGFFGVSTHAGYFVCR